MVCSEELFELATARRKAGQVGDGNGNAKEWTREDVCLTLVCPTGSLILVWPEHTPDQQNREAIETRATRQPYHRRCNKNPAHSTQ